MKEQKSISEDESNLNERYYAVIGKYSEDDNSYKHIESKGLKVN